MRRAFTRERGGTLCRDVLVRQAEQPGIVAIRTDVDVFGKGALELGGTGDRQFRQRCDLCGKAGSFATRLVGASSVGVWAAPAVWPADEVGDQPGRAAGDRTFRFVERRKAA